MGLKIEWDKAFATILGVAMLATKDTKFEGIPQQIANGVIRAQQADEDGDGKLSKAEKLRMVRDEVRIGIPIHNQLNPHMAIDPAVVDSEIDHVVSLIADAGKILVRKQTIAEKTATEASRVH